MGSKRKKAPTAAMKPPTLEEVTEYGTSIDLPTDECGAFHDYWTSQGWKPKGGPMQDWQARVRLWKRNWLERQSFRKNTPGKKAKANEDRTKPLEGVDYVLKDNGKGVVRVLPGSLTPFNEDAWYESRGAYA